MECMTNLSFAFFQSPLGSLGSLLPIALIMGVFYFLLIVPQRKRQKALQEMISADNPAEMVCMPT